MLELERLYQRSSVDAQVQQQAAQAAGTRAAAQAAAYESSVAECQLAQVKCQGLQRMASRRSEQVRWVQDNRCNWLGCSGPADIKSDAVYKSR
jgi:hypothetical protein